MHQARGQAEPRRIVRHPRQMFLLFISCLPQVPVLLLESLGRQTYLTPVELRLLQCLEEYYRVDEES
ncbi:MAG: hypothetical protein PUP91_19830 [Rhizonema sp. PD37]|nr:hypothetical protein [Rhizonema sp. PD37]